MSPLTSSDPDSLLPTSFLSFLAEDFGSTSQHLSSLAHKYSASPLLT